MTTDHVLEDIHNTNVSLNTSPIAPTTEEGDVAIKRSTSKLLLQLETTVPDTGSTNHLTNNFNNLSLQSDTYLGNNQIHVGDGGRSNPLAISQLITNLSHEFVVKDLGHLKYVLGMEAHQLIEGLLPPQSQYIFNLLKHTNMVDDKPLSSPMSSS
uniref:Reverse transcriptase Ty1/copia-type domain-containing protein n=1 Tax=Populus alba TaxID=43335 RepID=A0A4U5NR08_POPAL|nr:hypothetical protein D5086_0000250140 [Populus alba]